MVAARTTIRELLKRWFAIASAGWAPTTIRQTRSVLNRYLLPSLGERIVANLTTGDLDELYVELGRAGGVQGQPLAAGTLARIHVVLRSAFAHAVRWGWIWDNPAERAHRIVYVAPEIRPPSPWDVQTLLQHLSEQSPLQHLFVHLAAVTGARRAQLLGLRWDDVDLERGRIEFRRGWVEGPDGPVIAPTKTKRSHSVDIDPATVTLLDGLAAGHVGFVFSDDAGVTAWKPNHVTKMFGRARRGAGLGEFRLHDLRRFMATEMLHASIPIVVVSRRLDHRRVSTTLDRYAHAVPGFDRDACATVAALLTPHR